MANPKGTPANLKKGGNEGNKGGGRKPDEFKKLCRELATNPKAITAARKILSDPEHKQWSAVWKIVTEYGYGKPTQQVDVNFEGGAMKGYLERGPDGNVRLMDLNEKLP